MSYQELDKQDTLAHLRQQFYIPKHHDGSDALYFCGNSLGLQPRLVEQYLMEEVEDWRRLGVEGHTEARNPWLSYHEQFAQPLANIVGALPHEVVVMNGLTVNLHLLMVSFYRPTAQRFKILVEKGAFPSDKYAVVSQLRYHGYTEAEGLIEIAPREGEELIHLEDIAAAIEREGEQIALILIGGVNYYTGQVFDMQHITALGHAKGITVGFDLAHAAGNIPLHLHDWNVDFAAWCHYKYLNSGAGATAGVFIHEKHVGNPEIPRFEGWWGHDKSSRFQMPADFRPMATAEAWQMSNAPVFSMCPLRASLAVFGQTTMAALREKSIRLTNYLESLIQAIPTDSIRIITPSEAAQRGCQLSLQVKNADKSLHQRLMNAGVIADWREPDVIRIAPAPLYNSFEDVYRFVEILKTLV